MSVEKALRLAICDPGAITPRGDNYEEPLTSWQARAVLEHAAPLIADQAAKAERERIAQMLDAEVNRPGPGGGLPGETLTLLHIIGTLRE